MKIASLTAGLIAVACAACAVRPTPAMRIGSAEAAVRSARDTGASRLPDASAHLRLAEQQVADARRLLDDGEHQRAEWLLVRAEADATVAHALAREAAEKEAAARMESVR